ncbi:PREDICTED: uncharacterized protein LOC109210639 [Nicotiana attenuata]|uniref:uncharacterized protein LOC109210639 n=1 Tax=Nicotiana attenuata TaxID=49451 RepID=UPI0009051D79|nr:PREDICTED: uncharacterized protein LOC109210639 [Nicotiana attenuata]
MDSASAITFHSLASSVTVFNGLNFSEWREQVQFHLGVMDLDLALLNDKPAAITDLSSADEKSFHKAWERSNRLSLMFMRMNIANNIKSTISQTESTGEYLKFMEERFRSANKSLAEKMSGASGSRKPNMDEIMMKWQSLKCEWYNNKPMANLMLLWDAIKADWERIRPKLCANQSFQNRLNMERSCGDNSTSFDKVV